MIRLRDFNLFRGGRALAANRRNVNQRHRFVIHALPVHMNKMVDKQGEEHDIVALEGTAYLLLSEPGERREAVLRVIESARRSLRLVFYIFADDGIGNAVRDALVAALSRGVAVSMIVDGFGSAATPDAFFQPLIDAGARMCRFHPRYGRRYLFRNHQKMIVADEARALVGGFNIADDYFAPPEEQGWCDLGLELKGAVAGELAGWFDALQNWTRLPGARMSLLARMVRRHSDSAGAARLLLTGPMRRLSPMTRALRADLGTVRQLDMVAAYFSPNYGMLRRLGRIARRGGAVRIIGAALSDNNATVAAWRHCLHRLLVRGVEAREYEATKLHMKLVVTDDVVWIGSANFDMRSLYLNLELMLRIEDETLARQARELIDRLAEQSRRITRELHERRATWWRRLRWTIAYFLVATLDPAVSASFFRLENDETMQRRGRLPRRREAQSESR
jgi:cardiolipin synthase